MEIWGFFPVFAWLDDIKYSSLVSDLASGKDTKCTTLILSLTFLGGKHQKHNSDALPSSSLSYFCCCRWYRNFFVIESQLPSKRNLFSYTSFPFARYALRFLRIFPVIYVTFSTEAILWNIRAKSEECKDIRIPGTAAKRNVNKRVLHSFNSISSICLT